MEPFKTHLIKNNIRLRITKSRYNILYMYMNIALRHFLQSWQYRDRRKSKAGTMLYSYFEWLQGFFIVHSTIGSTVHSRPLNSLEHCICTTTITNIRPERGLNLVPPDYKPQSIRMSHRGRPVQYIKRKTQATKRERGNDQLHYFIIAKSHQSDGLCLPSLWCQW